MNSQLFKILFLALFFEGVMGLSVMSTLFTRFYDPAGGQCIFYGSTVDSNGDLIVTGFTNKGVEGLSIYGQRAVITSKITAAGTTTWTQLLSVYNTSTAYASAVGNDVAVDKAGNIYVFGSTDGDMAKPSTVAGPVYTGKQDYLVASYSSSGALLSKLKSGGTNDDYLTTGVFSSTDGAIYGGGYTSSFLYGSVTLNSIQTEQQVAPSILSYTVSESSLSYSNYTSSLGVGMTQMDTRHKINGMVLDSEDHLILVGETTSSMVGSTTSSGSIEFLIIKRSSNKKTTLWKRLDGGIRDDIARAVCVDGSDNIYVVGSSSSPLWSDSGAKAMGADDMAIVKYDKDGNRQWLVLYGGMMPDFAYGVAYRKNNIFVAGHTMSWDFPSRSGYSSMIPVGALVIFDTSGNAQDTFVQSSVDGPVYFYSIEVTSTMIYLAGSGPISNSNPLGGMVVGLNYSTGTRSPTYPPTLKPTVSPTSAAPTLPPAISMTTSFTNVYTTTQNRQCFFYSGAVTSTGNLVISGEVSGNNDVNNLFNKEVINGYASALTMSITNSGA